MIERHPLPSSRSSGNLPEGRSADPTAASVFDSIPGMDVRLRLFAEKALGEGLGLPSRSSRWMSADYSVGEVGAAVEAMTVSRFTKKVLDASPDINAEKQLGKLLAVLVFHKCLPANQVPSNLTNMSISFERQMDLIRFDAATDVSLDQLSSPGAKQWPPLHKIDFNTLRALPRVAQEVLSLKPSDPDGKSIRVVLEGEMAPNHFADAIEKKGVRPFVRGCREDLSMSDRRIGALLRLLVDVGVVSQDKVLAGTGGLVRDIVSPRK